MPTLLDRLHDPDRTILHRALRVAIALPLIFAFGLHVLHDSQFALLGAFGSFAALAMADFMGPRESRLRAHVGLCIAGALLVVIGTALSNTLWPAVIAMLIVGLALQFGMVLGGQFALGNNAAIIAFVVCVMVPAGPEAIGSRVAGWLVAMIASALVATFIWPRHERRELYQRMADACRPLAEVVRTVAEGGNAQAAVDATKSALDRLREVQSALGFRPIGPPGHQQALLGLVDSLGQGWRFSSVLASAGPLPETDRGLARAVASMLDAIADVLQRCAENRQGEVPDIEALVGVRHAHRQHLDDHARAALAANEPAGLVLARYTAVFPVRVLSFIALSMATDAIVMSGRTVRADDDFFIVEPTEAEGAVKHAANLLAPHLSLRSVWFHNSLRAGIALALAVLVAKMTDIGHAFWVVLATLSVLRSNVATTGSTVVSAVVGTFAGFVLATLVMLGVGTSSALLWASLPIAVFLAAYAPAAISFAAGQAMFALMVVMLFNLMVPAGWEVGVVRVEAVVTGAVVALVAALIIWPKGASAALRAEIASHTRAARRLVEASFGALIGKVDPAQVDAARAATLQTRHRVDEALAAYVGERSAKHVPLAVWGLIARVPILMRLAADAGIAMQRANYTGIESGDPTLHYEQALVVVGASFSDMADRLDTPGYVADAAVAALIADLDMVDGTQKQRDAISAAIVAYTDAHRDDPETVSRVMALNWGVGWLAFLAHIRRLADPAIDQVLSQADTPWWR